jgi:hypothetical protein
MTKLPVEQPPMRIAVILNWFDELQAKVPRGGRDEFKLDAD